VFRAVVKKGALVVAHTHTHTHTHTCCRAHTTARATVFCAVVRKGALVVEHTHTHAVIVVHTLQHAPQSACALSALLQCYVPIPYV